MRNWSIQVTYDARDDDGKKFRARSVIVVEAADIGSAYVEADTALAASSLENAKLGAIIPGTHMRVP